MDKIQSFLDRHEAFKKKGLRLNLEDLFDWNMLMEEMMDERTTLSSEYSEDKNEYENIEGSRTIGLKDLKDEKGKNLYTEIVIKAKVREELYKEKVDLDKKKNIIEKLSNKIDRIPEYINIVKKQVHMQG